MARFNLQLNLHNFPRNCPHKLRVSIQLSTIYSVSIHGIFNLFDPSNLCSAPPQIYDHIRSALQYSLMQRPVSVSFMYEEQPPPPR